MYQIGGFVSNDREKVFALLGTLCYNKNQFYQTGKEKAL